MPFVSNSSISQHLEVADSSGLQALHHASSKGQERLVTTLLEKGVDPDIRGKLNQTPLMLGQYNLMVGEPVFFTQGSTASPLV